MGALLLLLRSDDALPLSLPPTHSPAHPPIDRRAGAAPGRYPALSPAQACKLRALSAVSAADGVRTLAYEGLQRALGLPSVRSLEDLLITHCIYAGLIRGKLDQRNRCGG